MNRHATSWFIFMTTIILLLVGVAIPQAQAQIWDDRGICRDLSVQDIPVMKADSIPTGTPQSDMTITQDYLPDKGVYFGGKWHYGHNGIDTTGGSDIKALTNGIGILSRPQSKTNGWGESFIMAVRPNQDSEEILTFHYHHLKNGESNGEYWTSRTFSACSNVDTMDILGEMGKTGHAFGAHLHTTTRRWANLNELKAALENQSVLDSVTTIPLFGKAYAGKGVTSHVHQNLNPTGLIYNTFNDYVSENGNAPAYGWSLPYVLNMRKNGIEFGLFDGRYGAGELVTRREAARWLKIGRELSSESGNADFLDVPPSDPDYPYIEALADFPEYQPVIDPWRACEPNMFPSFCPDNNVNRAEALKMVIMTFYGEEYMDRYFDEFWNGTLNTVLSLFHDFDDVSGTEWYASYVYFGLQKGLVAPNASFNANQPVRREEMAKWIMMGRDHVFGQYSSACLTTFCPSGQYCDPDTIQCTTLPECIPTADNDCEIGGGINEGNCTPGQTASCGNCGTMTCGSNEQWGSCQNQGVCQPGQQQNQTCNGVGTQTKTCSNSCNWSGWGQCSAECSPGQTQQQPCTVNGQSGTTERSCNNSGQWGSWSSCQASCQDTYLASSSQSCYNNPQGSGNPTLCLNVQQNSGTSWKYRVCKQGGTFSSSFSQQLRDDNHLVNYSTYSESSGITCTGWKSFSVNQITGYGASNGAGIRAYIKSPASCTQAGCQYYSGAITIRKECL